MAGRAGSTVPTADPRRVSELPDSTAASRSRAAQRRSLIWTLGFNFAAIGIDVAVLDLKHLAAVLVLRLALVTPLGLVALAINRWSHNPSRRTALHAATIVAFVASVAGIGQIAPEPFAGRYLMAAQFIIFANALVSGLPWRATQITTVVGTAVYVAITASGLQWPPAWANLDLVAFCIVNCAMALSVRRRKDAQIAQFEEIRRNDARLKDDLRRANEALGRLSNTDPLTGAFNRRYLDELIEQAATSIVPSLGHGVLMVDVDHFKLFNDHGGHAAGDHCLQRIVAAIRDNIRPASDIVVRYGGEEFAVFLPGLDQDELLRAADRLRRAVEDLKIPHPAFAGQGVVTISVGVAIVEPGETFAEAIQRADASLYRAKHRGRNQVAA